MSQMSSNVLPVVFDGIRYSMGGIAHENTFGIVAFLDALGVKGVWQMKDPRKVLDDWNKVYYMFSDDLKTLDITGTFPLFLSASSLRPILCHYPLPY